MFSSISNLMSQRAVLALLLGVTLVLPSGCGSSTHQGSAARSAARTGTGTQTTAAGAPSPRGSATSRKHDVHASNAAAATPAAAPTGSPEPRVAKNLDIACARGRERATLRPVAPPVTPRELPAYARRTLPIAESVLRVLQTNGSLVADHKSVPRLTLLYGQLGQMLQEAQTVPPQEAAALFPSVTRLEQLIDVAAVGARAPACGGFGG